MSFSTGALNEESSGKCGPTRLTRVSNDSHSVITDRNDTMTVVACWKNSVQYVPPDGIFGIQIAQNSISAGAPPRNPRGELTTLPQTP